MIDSLQTIGAARGQDAMSNEEIHPHYVKLVAEKGKRPRDLAVSDFFKGINFRTSNKGQELNKSTATGGRGSRGGRCYAGHAWTSP